MKDHAELHKVLKDSSQGDKGRETQNKTGKEGQDQTVKEILNHTKPLR